MLVRQMTQETAILEYLKQGNTLTPLEALEKFSCFRLGARCWNLKRKGHNIKSKTVHDGKKHYSQYWLDSGEKKET
jgi:hypothetical protein